MTDSTNPLFPGRPNQSVNPKNNGMIPGLIFLLFIFSGVAMGPAVSANSFEPFGQYPVASPTLPRTRIRGFLFENADQSLLGGEAVLSHRYPLYGRDNADRTLFLEGSVFSQFQEDPNDYELINADYVASLPYEYSGKSHGYRIELYHQSSHLGDEFAARTGQQRISFSHESVRGLFFKKWSSRGRAFIGGEYALRMNPDVDRGMATVGFSQFYRDYYFASSAKFRNRNDWTPSISVHVGSMLMDDSISVALGFYDGPLPAGQFFRNERTAWSLLITFYN